MFRYFLYISLFIILGVTDIIPQETPQSSEFPIGTFIASSAESNLRHNPDAWNSVDTSGMNTFVQYADDITRGYLQNYNVIAENADNSLDKIYHYSIGYYSRWEAESNGSPSRTGFVHSTGSGHSANWKGRACWTNYTSTAACSLLYGPHYRQDKYWKPQYYPDTKVDYKVRYWLALDYDSTQVDPNTEICKLYITERYTILINNHWQDSTVHMDILDSAILKVRDFYGRGGNFKGFDVPYVYGDKFKDKNLEKLDNIPSDQDTVYWDLDGENGVEFKLDFLPNNSHIRNIYIDKVEVYDEIIWADFIDNPVTISNDIKDYALTFKNSGWDNMLNWYACDEPRTIDNYWPLRIIDSLLQVPGVECPHLITEMYPPWDFTMNGDTLLRKYVEIARPEPLMIDSYPFGEEDDNAAALENLRKKFQFAHSLQPGFWYVGQGFGEQDINNPNIWHIWRKPDSLELKASVMLALAHGIKGLLFWNYWSYIGGQPLYGQVYHNCLVDTLVNNRYEPTELYYLIQKDLAPRLKGTLGSTLLSLDYTGQFLHILQDLIPPDGVYPANGDYLALSSEEPFYNFYAGLLRKKNTSDDKYFLLINLRTDYNQFVTFTVNNNFSFNNIRVKYVEDPSIMDTSITTQLVKEVTMNPGEGYLFQVAPVVKYGGKLYASETLSNNTTLYDDMTIENGVTLTVDAVYDCYANIYTKGSGKVKTVNGGTIRFHNGKGIIAQGSPTIQGTSSHKLTIDFDSSPNAGIQFLQGANTQISYCILKNAENLVYSENSQYYTNISYCNFQNTTGYAVSLTGTSSHTPYITHCTFTGTDYGIFAAGQNSFTISYNTFTDNKLAVNLSQVSNPQIIGNTISSDQNSDPGISLSSCGGNIRSNTISGHSIGVLLANSSPQIGVNQIEDNYVNGIYVGTGSVPDLRGVLVGISPNKYPISGYNIIRNNGGYSLPYRNDDGSEIYFDNSNILLNYGCNYIADNRTTSPLLLTTLYLMNGSTTTEIIQATSNAWGDTVYSARFGDLTVNFTPYNDTICLIPQTEGMLIMSDNDGNTLDTLYSAGTPEYTPTSTDLQYSEAEEYMLNRDYSLADAIYNTIISNSPGSVNSRNAYLNLYKSKRIQNADSASMVSLREMFASNLGGITDSVMKKVVSQLSLLTLVDQRQYPQAINGFADIILQNPGTEEAIFAEIDAMTTSLLAGSSNDTTLGKGLAKSLLVKGFKDFQNRMNKLIHNKFGAESNPEENQIIPTQYSLYNNYPNPFNPTTTIRFDIPERTNVELIVYDILGRKVKTLVNNEARNPGRYEVSFNANALASGVYIYKLTTKNYSQARKMLLLK